MDVQYHIKKDGYCISKESDQMITKNVLWVPKSRKKEAYDHANKWRERGYNMIVSGNQSGYYVYRKGRKYGDLK